jgi:hypothetical protein
VHIKKFEAFPLGGHLLDQLSSLMRDGLMIDDRNLQVCILECQDLACIYSVVTRGSTSALGEIFAHGVQPPNLQHFKFH